MFNARHVPGVVLSPDNNAILALLNLEYKGNHETQCSLDLNIYLPA